MLPKAFPDISNAAPTLRILLIESPRPDRDLLRQAQGNEIPTNEFHYATSETELVSALEAGGFDLIVANISCASCNCSTALALVMEKCPTVPFLFLPGDRPSEEAIEAARRGDCGRRPGDPRDGLLPAVRQALSSAEALANHRGADSTFHRTEARFGEFFENSVEGIYQSSPDDCLLVANRTMARLCGYASPEELRACGSDLRHTLYVEPARRTAFVQLVREHAEVIAYESQIRRKDGALVWISENARGVYGAAGQLLYTESMVTDITARKAAEKALQDSEERFREMAEHINDVFYSTELHSGLWLYVSPAYEQIWGRPVAGLYAQPAEWIAAIVPEDREKVVRSRQQLAGGKEYHIEYRVRRPDGTLRWIEDRSYLISDRQGVARRAVGVAIDLTQRHCLEGQLLHAQKMEAMGLLAGGVAHDFNNILTVVIGFAQMLLDDEALSPRATERLTQIYNAGTRAANLTRQLLVFSRKQAVNRQKIDLNHVASEITEMLRRLIGEDIALELALSAEPCPTEADAGMIEQVLMNLAVNARDAMPNGGKLTIATERISIDDAAMRRTAEARPGKFVCLSVRDTGTGIAPGNLQRIFEPFFTTKEIGHGTGLGLAMAFGIVKQHQGWIEFDSTVGVGTCFRILLPAATGPVEARERRPLKTSMARGGTETILVVEDEASVREFAVAVLCSQGYRVLQASSGIEALEVWKWHGPKISLLVTDLVMPDGLGGLELAAKLRAERQTLRVVLTTGYVNETIGEELRPPAGMHFMHKPYRPQVLSRTVRDALDDNYNR